MTLMTYRFFKLLVLMMVVLTGFSACVRDYTCKCTIVYSGAPGLPDSLVRDVPIRDKKDKAKSLCEQNSNSSQSGNIKTVETCKIY